MNGFRYRKAYGPLAAVVLALAAGCSAPPAEVPSKPVFYPSSPNVPRLQFLTSFSDLDAWSSSRTSFADFIVGSKKGERSKIVSPYGLAAHKGKLYICDLGAHRVHVVDLARKTSTALGAPEWIENPTNITIDADGTKYVCDTHKRKVVVFDAQDRFVRALGDPAKCTPIDVAIRGDELYVADVDGAKIEVWSKDGKVLRTISSKGSDPGQLRMPTNVAIGPSGRIYVSDTGASTVAQFSADGQYLKPIGVPGDRPGEFARPKGIAVDPQGLIYVAESQWEVVQVFSPDGQLLLFFGGAAHGPESMGMPAGLAIDASCLPYFMQYVSKDFEPEYLLFVANQFGKHKIGVYAFGNTEKARKAAASRPRPTSESASAPSTRP